MNLHIFWTPCTHESRLLKETLSLAEHRYFRSIVIACVWEQGLPEHQPIDEIRTIWRVKLQSRRWPKVFAVQTLKYLEWMAKILYKCVFCRIDAVQCHSLAALPIGVVFKVLWRARLIYDAHELETETNGTHGLRKAVAILIERRLISFADAVIVVSDSIADWYQNRYNIRRPVVVKNIPTVPGIPDAGSQKSPSLKKLLRIKSDDILFLYQGAITKGRGIEAILNAFARVEKHLHIAFMGNGDLVDGVKRVAANHGNIHYTAAVPPQEVLCYTATADVGICFIENTCLSYYYSLPNKLFEYLLAGLPVIINNFPEQRKIIEQYGCGWIVEDEISSLPALIASIDKEKIAVKREKVLHARQNFRWANEAELFLAEYARLGITDAE